MLKIIRNTVFTATVLILTAVGIRWNNDVQAAKNPVSLGQTILASQSLGPVTPDFPLTISMSAPQLRLGETETISVATVPNASLDIITQYPDDSVNHPQTFTATANNAGDYSFNIPVSDFRYLGVFRVSVAATSGSKTTEAVANFAVISWQETAGSPAGQYVYPLAP
jgi:hypothetical protein